MHFHWRQFELVPVLASNEAIVWNSCFQPSIQTECTVMIIIYLHCMTPMSLCANLHSPCDFFLLTAVLHSCLATCHALRNQSISSYQLTSLVLSSHILCRPATCHWICFIHCSIKPSESEIFASEMLHWAAQTCYGVVVLVGEPAKRRQRTICAVKAEAKVVQGRY